MMTEELKEFPKNHRGRPQIYPWDEWTDGRVLPLRRGRDFEVSPISFRALCHRTATSRGMKVQTKIRGDDTVIVQFVEA